MILEAYSGIVQSHDAETLVVTLLNLRDPEADIILREFEIANLASEELEYLSDGAALSWTVECDANGFTERVSFLSTAPFSATDLRETIEQAHQYLKQYESSRTKSRRRTGACPASNNRCPSQSGAGRTDSRGDTSSDD